MEQVLLVSFLKLLLHICGDHNRNIWCCISTLYIYIYIYLFLWESCKEFIGGMVIESSYSVAPPSSSAHLVLSSFTKDLNLPDFCSMESMNFFSFSLVWRWQNNKRQTPEHLRNCKNIVGIMVYLSSPTTCPACPYFDSTVDVPSLEGRCCCSRESRFWAASSVADPPLKEHSGSPSASKHQKL